MYEILTLSFSILLYFQADKIVASIFKFAKLLSDKFFSNIGTVLNLPFRFSYYLIKKMFVFLRYIAKRLFKRAIKNREKVDKYTVEPVLKVTPQLVQQKKFDNFHSSKREPVIIEYIEE